jgi:hypothetical protein
MSQTLRISQERLDGAGGLKIHLLNDVDKEVVMADIKAWVADRVAAQV